MLLLTSFSDWRQTRGVPVLCVFICGVVGWAILLGVPAANPDFSQYSARYFACCLIVTAGYTNIPLIIAWQAGNCPSESQRATSLGMLNSIGQCLSILASYLFPTSQAPQYNEGCIINIAFQAFGMVLALGMTLYYRWENKRRDRLEGGRPEAHAHLDVVSKYDLAPGMLIGTFY
jgi:hypothetical protein